MAKGNSNQTWEEFFTPEILRNKLISASLYLAAFQILKNSVIDRLKDFYTFGFEENGGRVNP